MIQTNLTLFPQASEAAHTDIYRVLAEGKKKKQDQLLQTRSISTQLGVCPQCCERFEPLFGKHVCRQPEAKPVGYLFLNFTSFVDAVPESWRMICNLCAQDGEQVVPMFSQNLGQYRQPCIRCDAEINYNADPRWPVLFE